MIFLQQNSAFQKHKIQLKIYALKQQEIELSYELSLFHLKKIYREQNNWNKSARGNYF